MSHLPPPVSPQQPPYQRPSGGNHTGLIVLIVAAAVAVPVLIACVGVLIGLLLPAVQASREAARRMSCSNNLKQIVLALHNYHEAYQSFPPAYTTDDSGQPLHSWRTLILPFIEQQALYERVDLSKPWDDPANSFLQQAQIPAYLCPSSGVESPLTTYMAIAEPRAVLSGPNPVKIPAIIDGTSNTLMVLETDPQLAVPWMQPVDIDLQSLQQSMQAGTSSHHTGGFNAGFADGSVQFISENTDQQTLQRLITIDDARNGP